MKLRRFLVILLTSLLAIVHAQEKAPTPEQMAAFQKMMKTVGELQYQSGEINLAGGKVKVKLDEDFRYLDAANARKVLVEIWSNPPDAGSTDGMIVPKGVNFLGDDSWVAVLQWKEDGYVKDGEFDSTNFNDMLKTLKTSYHESSLEREKQGYGTMELVGWAQAPHYDKATHKLYWAKQLDVTGDTDQLNYDIRVLGRAGHLEVSIMSVMPQLKDIEAKAPAILSMVDFTEGNRYADYKAGDKVASYGIAALIAGGVLAKSGAFKVILIFLAKFWKLFAIGAVAIGSAVKKMFGGRDKPQQ